MADRSDHFMPKHRQHSESAAAFLSDMESAARHDDALWQVRVKRDRAVSQVPDWMALRRQASAIKNHTLSCLDRYLVQLEERAIHNGIVVHWASDADEHNRIAEEILRQHGIRDIVKSKSMLTEECGLNEYLEKRGYRITDTDLGERIVQLAGEPPSHIVLPAIHKRTRDIASLFERFLKTQPGKADPEYLVKAARRHLRKHFLKAGAAITGVNFAIAETGALVVCTNEGNADMGVHLAKVHIASMGIEKVIPSVQHLPVFLQLLARSATGQTITTYTSQYMRPLEGKELHLIIVDNGRSQLLGDDQYRDALKCIRCGACLNTCPIYRRSGGHSYRNAISGPIGAVLAPHADLRQNADLPFASTLCGSCTQVCPVEIPLHRMLLTWRQSVTAARADAPLKSAMMKILANVFLSPRRVSLLLYVYRKWPFLAKNRRVNAWFRDREMPEPPADTFESWWRKHRGTL